MKFLYDGDSSLMIGMGNQIFRVQRLVDNRWETVESEGVYRLLFPELHNVDPSPSEIENS